MTRSSPVGMDDDLDLAGHDHVEVVVGVTFAVEVVTGRHQTAHAERRQHRQLRGSQFGERIGLSQALSLSLI